MSTFLCLFHHDHIILRGTSSQPLFHGQAGGALTKDRQGNLPFSRQIPTVTEGGRLAYHDSASNLLGAYSFIPDESS